MPRYVSEECQFVIKGLLKHLPKNRLSIKQIKQTKFLHSRRFSEPLPSYRLRRCKQIKSDQLLNSTNLKSSSTLQLISTNDCCKYAKRPVSDGENYSQLKKQDDNYNCKLSSLVQSKQSTDGLIIDDSNKQQQELNSELINNKGSLSPQSDSGHCDEDSCCKSIENQSLQHQYLDQLPPPVPIPQSINSTTKLNLHYYNDQQYYPSQAVSYQNKSSKQDEDSGVFKSEHSPKISFESIENINSPITDKRREPINNTPNYPTTDHYYHQQQTSKTNNQCIQEIIRPTIEQKTDLISSTTIAHRVFNEKLSADEEATLKQLKELGISEKMLEENVDNGVKNSLIGIYRLVLHNVIASRVSKEKEEYRAAKRKQKLMEELNSLNKRKDKQANLAYEENRLRKSVSNGQFYDESEQTNQQSQLISSKTKSNRMHLSMDGLKSSNKQEEINELDDDLILESDKLANGEMDRLKNDELEQNLNKTKEVKPISRYTSSEEDLSSLLFSGDEEEDNKYLDDFNNPEIVQNGNRKQYLNDDIDPHYRQFNDESFYNQQVSAVNKKRSSRRLKESELNKQNMINAKINQDEDYLMKCDLMDTNYDHHSYYVPNDLNNSVIINTNNLDANLYKMKTKNLMNDCKKTTEPYQPFKPYLHNYLEEEKKWKKQKKKKKLKKRSVISCCIF